MTIEYPAQAAERLRGMMVDNEIPVDSGPYAEENRRKNNRSAPIPSQQHLEDLVSASFMSSVRTEEGHPTVFSLAYVSTEGLPSKDYTVIRFKQAREFNTRNITKIATGTDPYTTFLCVFPEGGQLLIWGLAHAPTRPLLLSARTTDSVWQHHFLLLRIPTPGVLYAYYHVRMLMVYAHGETYFSPERGRLTAILRDRARVDNAEEIAQLAARIGQHGRGGTILITDPAANTTGLDVTYAFAEPFRHLSEVLRTAEGSGHRQPDEDRATAVLDFVADLSRVDGAIHLASDLTVYGYGTKIHAPHEPLKLLVEDPDTGAARTVDEGALRGMRHRSAAWFCAQQAGQALAVVVSQDGDVSFLGRQPDGSVRMIGPFVLGTGITVA